MKLGNQVEWALHCLEFLARVPDNYYVPTKVLANFHGVPKEYLSKAMQSLASAKLVEGTLGPKGGYRLSKLPSKINLLEIVEAVEGRKRTFNCQEIRFNNPCLKEAQKKKSSVCVIANTMFRADEAWRNVLRTKLLSDLVNDIDKQIPPEVIEQCEKWLLNEI